MPLKTYDLNNWYWIVGGDQTKVYSSALGDYVPAADAEYTAWLADNTAPTSIDNEANLGAVISDVGAPKPAAPNVLAAWRDGQASNHITTAVFKILFNHENRLRALEGKAAITAAQFLAALKQLM